MDLYLALNDKLTQKIQEIEKSSVDAKAATYVRDIIIRSAKLQFETITKPLIVDLQDRITNLEQSVKPLQDKIASQAKEISFLASMVKTATRNQNKIYEQSKRIDALQDTVKTMKAILGNPSSYKGRVGLSQRIEQLERNQHNF